MSEEKPEVNKPLLSVVIIGRNEAEHLDGCLQSVLQISAEECSVELIYVDSRSEDNSIEIATRYNAKVVCLEEGLLSASRARNVGWRHSAGGLILFLDGDMLLEPSFVIHALKEFRDSAVAVVFGVRRERYPERSIYNRLIDLDWKIPAGFSEHCGGDSFMRRSMMMQLGGFDESLVAGEEPELCRRARQEGFRVVFVDKLMTYHDIAMTEFGEYWRRAVRSGYAYANMAFRSKNTSPSLWVEESRANILRGSFLFLLLVGAPVVSLMFATPIPLLAAVCVFVGTIARTYSRVGWRTRYKSLRFLYTLHSQFQHIPILVGQIKFWSTLLRKD